MHPFDGDIAWINLSTGAVKTEPTRPYLLRFPGGRALNQYLLFKHLALGTHPFDINNIIAFGAGLLSGMPYPGATRLNVDSLNALTGGIGSSSCGGGFGSELKRTGLPHLLLTGRPTRPVYLWINDSRVEIRDAGHLWGRRVYETETALKNEVGDDRAHVLAIGPAGENLARSACIMVDKDRALGRCGLGAVLGAKRVKAIVVRGTKIIEPENRTGFRDEVRRIRELLSNDEFNALRRKYGVNCYDPWLDESQYHNFQGGYVPSREMTDLIGPDEFLKHKVASKGCEGCPISCWATHETIDEDGSTIRTEALQGNDPQNFGAKLGIFDAKAILSLHTLCNDLGLDEDNACGAIAWAFECFQKGTSSLVADPGFPMEWGNVRTVRHLIEQIALRQGVGDLLAEGSYRASRLVGGEDYSIHIKGQELQEIMRTRIGWALGTAVSARGGTHTRGAVQEYRIADTPQDTARRLFGLDEVGLPHEYVGKERLVSFYERLQAMLDSLGVCLFTNSGRTDFLLPEHYIEALATATGWRITEEEFAEIGERAHCLEKCFNVLHRGWGRDQDVPPARFFDEPVVNGARAGDRLDRHEWERLLDRYYEIHGWDIATGWPTMETLHRLGLEDVASTLSVWNKLP